MHKTVRAGEEHSCCQFTVVAVSAGTRLFCLQCLTANVFPTPNTSKKRTKSLEAEDKQTEAIRSSGYG